jgi:hypothetical protein
MDYHLLENPTDGFVWGMSVLRSLGVPFGMVGYGISLITARLNLEQGFMLFLWMYVYHMIILKSQRGQVSPDEFKKLLRGKWFGWFVACSIFRYPFLEHFRLT